MYVLISSYKERWTLKFVVKSIRTEQSPRSCRLRRLRHLYTVAIFVEYKYHIYDLIYLFTRNSSKFKLHTLIFWVVICSASQFSIFKTEFFAVVEQSFRCWRGNMIIAENTMRHR